MRLGEHATFLGWLDREQLADAYASADVFLFCSRTDTYGQVIAEAQASGLPVVAVDEGGPATLIRDRQTGWLCEPEPGASSPRRSPSSRPRRSCASGSRGRRWPRSAGAPGRRRWPSSPPATRRALGALAPQAASPRRCARSPELRAAVAFGRSSWSPLRPRSAVPAEVDEQPATAAPPAGPDLEDPELYFNRELSWLDFNDRVLQLAEDPNRCRCSSAPSSRRSGSRTSTRSSWSGSPTSRTMVEAGTQARAADGMLRDGDARGDPRAGARPARARRPRRRARAAPGAGRARDPDHHPRAGLRRGARGARATCSSARCSRS